MSHRTQSADAAANLKGLWPIVEALREREFVDLTHEFHAEIPHSEDMPVESTSVLYNRRPPDFE